MRKSTHQTTIQTGSIGAALDVQPTGISKPEFFRLPKSGGDPHFGLTRSWYYAAEKQGLITLIRLRQRGKLRGVTLVPYDAVKNLIEEAGE